MSFIFRAVAMAGWRIYFDILQYDGNAKCGQGGRGRGQARRKILPPHTTDIGRMCGAGAKVRARWMCCAIGQWRMHIITRWIALKHPVHI